MFQLAALALLALSASPPSDPPSNPITATAGIASTAPPDTAVGQLNADIVAVAAGTGSIGDTYTWDVHITASELPAGQTIAVSFAADTSWRDLTVSYPQATCEPASNPDGYSALRCIPTADEQGNHTATATMSATIADSAPPGPAGVLVGISTEISNGYWTDAGVLVTTPPVAQASTSGLPAPAGDPALHELPVTGPAAVTGGAAAIGGASLAVGFAAVRLTRRPAR